MREEINKFFPWILLAGVFFILKTQLEEKWWYKFLLLGVVGGAGILMQYAPP